MEKRIQIPVSLYKLMVEYIEDHFDPGDRDRFFAIRSGVERKSAAEIRHNLYSAYKTSPDPEVREMTRCAYLDMAGIPSHGRWNEETENHFRDGNFDC